MEDNNRQNVLFLIAIKSKFKNCTQFANAIGWSRQKVSSTVNCHRTPSLKEIQEISNALGLSITTIVSFFIYDDNENSYGALTKLEIKQAV